MIKENFSKINTLKKLIFSHFQRKNATFNFENCFYVFLHFAEVRTVQPNLLYHEAIINFAGWILNRIPRGLLYPTELKVYYCVERILSSKCLHIVDVENCSAVHWLVLTWIVQCNDWLNCTRHWLVLTWIEQCIDWFWLEPCSALINSDLNCTVHWLILTWIVQCNDWLNCTVHWLVLTWYVHCTDWFWLELYIALISSDLNCALHWLVLTWIVQWTDCSDLNCAVHRLVLTLIVQCTDLFWLELCSAPIGSHLNYTVHWLVLTWIVQCTD